MSHLRFHLLLAVLYSCSVLGHGDQNNLEVKTIPLNHEQVMVSFPETASTNTTTTSTTTHKPTTTSTTSTTSTTPKTTTTTTSTTPKTTTTTEVPTTTPKPAPTPTPAPTPAPGPLTPPTQGTWKMVENNDTCILVQFAAQLNVTYTKVADNSTGLGNVFINVPPTANVTDGSCSGDQWLTISWMVYPNSTFNASLANNMTLVYNKNVTANSYALRSLNVSLTPQYFINGTITEPVKMWHGPEWQTSLQTSYRCHTPTQLNMTSEIGSAAVTLSRLQEQAYMNSSNAGFSAAHNCLEDDVPDAVPIAVGCALGGLVVVVLVAYLIGRRRSAARGYLSM